MRPKRNRRAAALKGIRNRRRRLADPLAEFSVSEMAERTQVDPEPVTGDARRWGEKFEAAAQSDAAPHTTWRGSSIPAMLGALSTAIDNLETRLTPFLVPRGEQNEIDARSELAARLEKLVLRVAELTARVDV